jgi:hypothetical protein
LPKDSTVGYEWSLLNNNKTIFLPAKFDSENRP